MVLFSLKMHLKRRLQFVSIWTSLKFCRLVVGLGLLIVRIVWERVNSLPEQQYLELYETENYRRLQIEGSQMLTLSFFNSLPHHPKFENHEGGCFENHFLLLSQRFPPY